MSLASPLVLHVLPQDLPRGAQRYARAMRDALDGRGARHRVLTLFASSFSELRADEQLGLEPGRLARSGLDPRVIFKLNRALAHLQPSCLVAHGSQPLKYLTFAAPPRFPIISYRLGIAHRAAHRAPQRAFHALLYRRALRVAGVSDECLEEAAALFLVPRDRLVLIPNGRDPEQFRPGVPDERAQPPRLTFVGHLSDTKRPDWFLEVVARLRARGLRFSAEMIGDGPLHDALVPRARELEVELLGRRNDVAERLRQASILAFTSIPDGEGMPGVFIEAGLSGVPVVSTAAPGARTVIADGETGFVVGVDDQAGFADQVARLIEDSDLRARMSSAARARCLAEFTLAGSVARWQSLFADLFGWAAQPVGAENGVTSPA